MNTEQALEFLRQHQPMPADSELTEDLMREYDEVCQHFVNTPDQRCIPLLLGSFGDGDGFGLYQLVEDVMAQFPPEVVIPYLSAALSSSSRAVRCWAAEISASFARKDLLCPLRNLLEEDDEDVQAAAVLALGQIRHREARQALDSALQRTSSQHLQSLIREQLES